MSGFGSRNLLLLALSSIDFGLNDLPGTENHVRRFAAKPIMEAPSLQPLRAQGMQELSLAGNSSAPAEARASADRSISDHGAMAPWSGAHRSR